MFVFVKYTKFDCQLNEVKWSVPTHVKVTIIVYKMNKMKGLVKCTKVTKGGV